MSVSPSVHHTVTLGSQVTLGRSSQLKSLVRMATGPVISLCLSTHLSEEEGGPGQWFSHLGRLQVHLPPGQKQVPRPLPNLLNQTPEMGSQNLYP